MGFVCQATMGPLAAATTIIYPPAGPQTNPKMFVCLPTSGPPESFMTMVGCHLQAPSRSNTQVHHLVPPVDRQRSTSGPLDKIICHSTAVPPAGVYGSGRDCAKLLPARWQ